MPKVTRLYNSFKPSRYELYLKPDKSKLSFDGQLNLFGRQEIGQKHLVLHVKDLVINKLSIDGYESSFKVDNSKNHLVINMPANTAQDIVLKASFSGRITKQMHGLYP